MLRCCLLHHPSASVFSRERHLDATRLWWHSWCKSVMSTVSPSSPKTRFVSSQTKRWFPTRDRPGNGRICGWGNSMIGHSRQAGRALLGWDDRRHFCTQEVRLFTGLRWKLEDNRHPEDDRQLDQQFALVGFRYTHRPPLFSIQSKTGSRRAFR